MKKTINNIITVFAVIMLLTLIVVFAASCGKNSDPKTNDATIAIDKQVVNLSSNYRKAINDLPKTISTTLPIDVDNDELPYYISDGYESVYTKHTVSQSYDGLLAVGTMDNIWYPGALLKISYDEAYNNELMSINLKRNPINISASLETVEGVDPEGLTATIEHPENLSESRVAVNKIIQNIYGNKNVNIPTRLTSKVIQMTADQSLDVVVGTNTGFCGFNLSASFGYSTTSSRTRAVLLFNQIYFTIDADRPTSLRETIASKHSNDDIISELQEGTLPVYVSVVYGRIAIVTIETDMSMEDLRASINTGYRNLFDLSASLEKIEKNQETYMDFYIYGGSSESVEAIKLSTVSEFIDALTKTTNQSPLPIGYRFYYLDNGSVAKIANNTEYYSRTMRPIEVKDFSFSMRKYGEVSTIVTDTVRAGDVLGTDLTVTPSSARIFDVSYSINKCIDLNGNPYASIDTETGRLTIKENALIGDKITVTCTLTQVFNGNKIVKYYDKVLTIAPIDVKRIEIAPNSGQTQVIQGSSLEFNANIYPGNASFSKLIWTVDSGPATFINATKAVLKVHANAVRGDVIVVHATSEDGVESNKIVLDVITKMDIVESITISATGNEKNILAGNELILSVITYPLDYDIDIKDVTFVISEGEEYAQINGNKLFVKLTCPGGKLIKLYATYGNIKSNSLTFTVIESAIVENDNSGLVLKFPPIENVKKISVSLYKSDNTSLGQFDANAGTNHVLSQYLGVYCGDVRIILKYIMRDGTQYIQEFVENSMFESGLGTKSYPYIITVKRHLFNIRYANSAYYELASDIIIDNVDEWEAISKFNGVLNGVNHVITFNKKLTVSLQAQNDIFIGGLIEKNYGTVKNLSIVNLTLASSQNYHAGTYLVSMGGIVGVNYENAIIENVTVKNSNFTCDRNNSAFGPIAGVNFGIINNCKVTSAEIYSTGDCGGISGRNSGGKITNCTFAGTIGLYIANNNGGQSLRSFGGIAGYMSEDNSEISNCTVDSVSFNYYGESSIYHKKVLGIHGYCNLQIKVGIICGHIGSSKYVFNANTFNSNNCKAQLKLLGGKFHYGNHEKKYLFSYYNGMVGCV